MDITYKYQINGYTHITLPAFKRSYFVGEIEKDRMHLNNPFFPCLSYDYLNFICGTEETRKKMVEESLEKWREKRHYSSLNFKYSLNPKNSKNVKNASKEDVTSKNSLKYPGIPLGSWSIKNNKIHISPWYITSV